MPRTTKKTPVKQTGKHPLRGVLFKPGQSGNPKGRPKKAFCITSQLKDVLDEVPPILPNGKENKQKYTWARIIAQQAVYAAADGNASILKEVLDRSEGKVADKVEHVEPKQTDTEKVKATLRLIHGKTG